MPASAPSTPTPEHPQVRDRKDRKAVYRPNSHAADGDVSTAAKGGPRWGSCGDVSAGAGGGASNKALFSPQFVGEFVRPKEQESPHTPLLSPQPNKEISPFLGNHGGIQQVQPLQSESSSGVGNENELMRGKQIGPRPVESVSMAAWPSVDKHYGLYCSIPN